MLITKLWEILWKMWELRNSIVQEHQIASISPENEILNAQVCSEFEKGLGRLPNRYLIFFSCTLQEMIHKSARYKQQWFLTIYNLREQYGGRSAELQHRSYLIRWLNNHSGR